MNFIKLILESIYPYINHLQIEVWVKRKGKYAKRYTLHKNTINIPSIRWESASFKKDSEIIFIFNNKEYRLQFLSVKRYARSLEWHEKRQAIKNKIEQQKWEIQQQSNQKVNPLLPAYIANKGFIYNQLTGIISTDIIPIIKDIENGYEVIYYDNKKISSHRLIFAILNIDITGKHIHHIDRNKRNNIFTNLQPLDPSEHMKLHSFNRANNIK